MQKFKKPPTTIFIHCSGDLAFPNFERIKDLHLKRGFSDIGYHFVIEKDGAVKVGRPIDVWGAHSSGHNDYSIAVCLCGNYPMDFTRQQFESLAIVCGQLRANNPAIKELVGHYEIDKKGKVCPNLAAPLLRLWLGFPKRPHVRR